MSISIFLRIIILIIWGCVFAPTSATGEGSAIVDDTPRDLPQGFFQLRLDERILVKTSSSTQDALTFKEIRQVVVDSRSNIYILDSKPAVVKCDPQGRFLSLIGGRGSGPGEYSNPTAFYVDVQDRLAVIDQNRFVIRYDERGVFRDKVSIANGIEGPFVIFPSGRIMGFTRRFNTDGIRKVLALFDDQGHMEKELASLLEFPLTPGESKRPGFVLGGIRHRYSRSMLLCSVGADHICYGLNLEYELRIFDEDGRVLGAISNTEPTTSTKDLARELERKWGKQYLDQYGLPPTKPFFQSILSDDENRVFIIRTPDFIAKEKSRVADVYSASGQLLFRTEFPISPSVLRNRSIYAIDTDEEGWYQVIEYRILNGNDMPPIR